ncbi:MAG: hypothetical protein ABI609_05700 [Acidobacteriota bacterium]
MAERKPFLLRINPELLDALQKWAGDELRSVNGQIEFLLRDSLARAGRSPTAGAVTKRRAKNGEHDEP